MWVEYFFAKGPHNIIINNILGIARKSEKHGEEGFLRGDARLFSVLFLIIMLILCTNQGVIMVNMTVFFIFMFVMKWG